jgi:hypothetical protein
MVIKLAWAAGLVFGTTLIHTLFTIGIVVRLRSFSEPNYWVMRNAFTRAAALALVVFTMSIAAYFEALMWALFYFADGALSSIEDAVYFSLVTFTTLGYGDITLSQNWRVIGAFQAANGIILFGWTTAIIVAVGQRVFAGMEAPSDAPPS